MARRVDELRCTFDRLGVRVRPAAVARLLDLCVRAASGHVLGKFDVDRARPLCLGVLEGVPEHRRNGPRVDDRRCILRDGPHQADHVDKLEAGLPVVAHRLLAGDGDERRADELGVGDARHQVRGARPERGKADARLAGEPAVGGGHERRRLLVARDNELDVRRAERLEEIEVLLARQAEDVLDALLFQLSDEQVRCFHERS